MTENSAKLLTEMSDDKSLTRFYKVFGSRKIRVRVLADFYERQSLAAVDLLAERDGWTSLFVLPTSTWWGTSVTDNRVFVTDKKAVAAELLARALQILEP